MTLEEKLKIFKEKGYTYDPETGIVTSHKGKIIKNDDCHGYIQLSIKINKVSINIKAHQFAWYINYCEVPNDQIDHINHNRSDNKIHNLRSVTNQQNSFNKNNVKGYYFNSDRNIYQSYIKLNNKHKYIGCYKTPEEAHQAYLDAKKIYHII